MSLSVQTLHSLHGFFWVKSLNVTPTPQTEGFSKDFQGFLFCFFPENYIFLTHFYSDVNSKVQKTMLNLSHLMSCLKFCVYLLPPIFPQSPSALNTAPSSQEQCMIQTCCLYTCGHEVFWETEKHHWTLAGPLSVSFWTMLTLTGAYGRSSLWSSVCYQHLVISIWFMVIRPRTSGPSWTKECFNKSWGLLRERLVSLTLLQDFYTSRMRQNTGRKKKSLQIAHSQIPTYFSSNSLAGATEH